MLLVRKYTFLICLLWVCQGRLERKTIYFLKKVFADR